MSKGLSLGLGLLTGAIAALGTIRSIIEIAGGQSFSPQLIAFYIGAAAMVVYFAFAGTGMVAGLILAGLQQLNGGKDLSDNVENVAIGIGATVGLSVAAAVIFSGTIFDYDSTGGVGRGFFALLGLVALAGGVYLWQHFKQKPNQPA